MREILNEIQWLRSETQNTAAKCDHLHRCLSEHQEHFNKLVEKVNRMSQELDNLTAAAKAADDKLDSLAATVVSMKSTLAAQQAEIDALKASGIDTAKLQAIADELNAHVASADSTINPPAPEPVPAQ